MPCLGLYTFIHIQLGAPAIDHEDGECRWYVNDKEYEYVIPYCEVCGFDEETTMFWLLKYGDKLSFIMVK